MSRHTQQEAEIVTPTPERLTFRWLHHNVWKWNGYPGRMSHRKYLRTTAGPQPVGFHLTHAQCDHGLTTIAKQRAILQPARLLVFLWVSSPQITPQACRVFAQLLLDLPSEILQVDGQSVLHCTKYKTDRGTDPSPQQLPNHGKTALVKSVGGMKRIR